MFFRNYPVSDRSSQNGHHTLTARKSQEHWDYAQQIAPDNFITMRKYLFATEITVSILMLFLPFSVLYAVIIGTDIGFAWLGYGFYVTDKQIKQRFGGNSKRNFTYWFRTEEYHETFYTVVYVIVFIALCRMRGRRGADCVRDRKSGSRAREF